MQQQTDKESQWMISVATQSGGQGEVEDIPRMNHNDDELMNDSEIMLDTHILSDYSKLNVNIEYIDELMNGLIKSHGLNGFDELNRYPMDQILLRVSNSCRLLIVILIRKLKL